ncbi:hypothetical protein TRFO_32588 [Tritrichomonas foetus]|uniref:Uncharacterized protein n=1 Tax=Tritrichomonas foetus TaxID=1144522 RepID=A0A1J4JNL6_9EUKA|nr:hypothetical protein TRFO_32588 [Tritrichomonas foetus]|eukprot:OHT00675.1 hypothetical protein TRFO_32588 [Tritrichomonas foetus]
MSSIKYKNDIILTEKPKLTQTEISSDYDDFDYDDNDEIYYNQHPINITDDVTKEVTMLPNMDESDKYRFYQKIQSYIFDVNVKFDPNPFSPESLEILFSTIILNEICLKFIFQLALFLSKNFPEDVKILANLGIFNICDEIFNMKVCFDMIPDIFYFLESQISKDSEFYRFLVENGFFFKVMDFIFHKDDLIFPDNYKLVLQSETSSNTFGDHLMESRDHIFCEGCHLLQNILPLLPLEILNNEYLSNYPYIEIMMDILSEKIFLYNEYKKASENSFDQKIPKPVNYQQNKQVVIEVLNLLIIFCQRNIEVVSKVMFLYPKNDRKKLPFLFYLIECRRLKKIKQIFVSLSKIVNYLLIFNFDLHFEFLKNFGIYDFVLFFLNQRKKLSPECIQIINSILINQPNDEIFHTALFNNLRGHLNLPYEIKYPICLALSHLSINASSDLLLKFIKEINILPDLFECIYESNEKDIIVLLKGIHRLLDFCEINGFKEEIMNKLGSESLDEIDFCNSFENEEIQQLFHDITRFFQNDE